MGEEIGRRAEGRNASAREAHFPERAGHDFPLWSGSLTAPRMVETGAIAQLCRFEQFGSRLSAYDGRTGRDDKCCTNSLPNTAKRSSVGARTRWRKGRLQRAPGATSTPGSLTTGSLTTGYPCSWIS